MSFTSEFEKSGVYKITNLINGKVYIGQSVNIKQRWYDHKKCIKKDYLKYPLYEDYRKYGIENFKLEILIETYDRDYWEKWFIHLYHSNDLSKGYNLTDGGSIGFSYINKLIKDGKIPCPQKNREWSEESKEKLRKYRLGTHPTEETIAKLRAARKVYYSTKENREAHDWVSHLSEEDKEKYIKLQRDKSKIAKKIICNQTGEIFNSIRYLCLFLNIGRTRLINSINKQTSINGYTYSYIKGDKK